MDPFSAGASGLAVVTVAAQSCSFLYKFFRGVHDAPAEVQQHTILLRGLCHTFSTIKLLSLETRPGLQFSRSFQTRLTESLVDLRGAESRIREVNSKLKRGGIKRTWTRLK